MPSPEEFLQCASVFWGREQTEIHLQTLSSVYLCVISVHVVYVHLVHGFNCYSRVWLLHNRFLPCIMIGFSGFSFSRSTHNHARTALAHTCYRTGCTGVWQIYLRLLCPPVSLGNIYFPVFFTEEKKVYFNSQIYRYNCISLSSGENTTVL